MRKISTLLFLVFFSYSAFAGVFYKNISYSPSSSAPYYFLDLDNNGVNDYLIRLYSYSHITIRGLNQNQVETDGSRKAISLNTGAPVGNNSWQDSATIYNFNSGALFYFPTNGSINFCGLKLIQNGQTFYGYLALSISGSSSLNFFDLSFCGVELTAGAGILAGSTDGVGVRETENAFVCWLRDNHLQMKNIPVAAKMLSICSVDGKITHQLPINPQNPESLPIELTSGCWIALLNDNQGKTLTSFRLVKE